MKSRVNTFLDILISFLDRFIHPKIFKLDHSYLVRSRIMLFWVMVGVILVTDLWHRFGARAGPWHPLSLILYYCYLEFILMFVSLRVFGSFRAALYVLMFSLYINTPVIVMYTGGLYSPSFIFYLFLPFGLYHLTRSLNLTFIAALVGIIESVVIYYMHRIGWDFLGKSIFVNFQREFIGNLLVCMICAWLFTLIYWRSLSQAYAQMAEAKRYESVLHLSQKIVAELKVQTAKIKNNSQALEHEINNNFDKDKINQNILEIDQTIKQMSLFISALKDREENAIKTK